MTRSRDSGPYTWTAPDARLTLGGSAATTHQDPVAFCLVSSARRQPSQFPVQHSRLVVLAAQSGRQQTVAAGARATDRRWRAEQWWRCGGIPGTPDYLFVSPGRLAFLR